jgi:iron complex outermembrane recepter protein
MQKLLVLCLWLSSAPAAAQTLWRGRVADAVTNQPLPGVNLRLKTGGTATNAQGQFELAATGDTLHVTCLGYQPLALPWPSAANWLNISLQPAATQLTEVVVTALQTDGRLLQVPGAVAVLGPRELHRDNDVTLVPALNRVPGVYMHTGTLNTNRLTIRGIGSRSLFSTNKVRAYFGDIPLTTGDGETTLEDLDLSLIGRAEVIKGPSSSVYGAGLGGTVVLTARKAAYRERSLGTEGQVGSFGLRRWVGRAASGSDRANLSVVLSQQNLDGYRENNAYDRFSVATLGQWQAGERTSVTLLANHIRLKAFIPSSIDEVTYRQNPRAAAANWLALRGYEAYQKTLLGVSVSHELGRRSELAASVFTTQRFADEPRPFNFLRESSQSWGARGRASGQLKWGHTQLKWLLGGEVFGEWYGWRTFRNQNGRSGPALSDQEEVRTYYNVFAQAELAASEQFTLTAGANLNQTSYDLTDLFPADNLDLSGRRDFTAIVSPRVAANWRPWAGLGQAIYATVSHGFSPPTLAETLTPTGQINPAIRPETGLNYELGWRGQALGQRLSFDVSYFWMDVRNLLVARRTADDAFVGVNAGRTRHQGLEMAAQYNLVKHPGGWLTAAQAFVAATWGNYRFVDFVDADRDYSGLALPGTPPRTANAGVDVESRPGLYAHLNWQFTDAVPLRDDNAGFSEAYQLVNLRLGWRRTWLGWLQTHAFGGWQNLLDQRYASMILVNATGATPRYYYPGLPRNWFAGLGLVAKW